MVESFGCLIIFYIGLKCHFNYFVLYNIYIYIALRILFCLMINSLFVKCMLEIKRNRIKRYSNVRIFTL